MAKLIVVTVGTSALEHSDCCKGSVKNWRDMEELTRYLEEERRRGENREYNHQKEQALIAMRENLEYYYGWSIGSPFC